MAILRGMGTQRTLEVAKRAWDIGVTSVEVPIQTSEDLNTVSPGTSVEVIQACAEAGLAHLPGVATPSDIQLAASHGLDWVKAFPASVLGADWLKAMGGPFPRIKFVSTGGMDAHNTRVFLDGCCVTQGFAGERECKLMVVP